MPTLKKWSPEEIEAATAKKNGSGINRKAIETAYDQLIADLGVGDWATVTPDDGETKPTVRNRLRAAASRRQLATVFQRTKDTSVVFHLEQVEE